MIYKTLTGVDFSREIFFSPHNYIRSCVVLFMHTGIQRKNVSRS